MPQMKSTFGPAKKTNIKSCYYSVYAGCINFFQGSSSIPETLKDGTVPLHIIVPNVVEARMCEAHTGHE